ncbi:MULTISPECIES: hypothetical protein [unclassified Burkholderia]|uniref:hypothetical protein n=1 Tax=unclassified Burkholderia TaxID=2613784 RepID=UPI002AB1209B|nr:MULTISPECIES: hypothetical protein [unclassified Burkholderia]
MTTPLTTVDDLFLDHLPVRAPRSTTPGEGILLSLWQEYAVKHPNDFEYIFLDMNEPIDQRIASVAASFMVFMGCNGGASFTHQAQEMWKTGAFSYPREAYLAAFALNNQRRRGVNGGLRTIEFMLAPTYPFEDPAHGGHQVMWQVVPEITQKDMDAVDCMVGWWASPPAKAIRHVAEPEIEAANRRARSELFGYAGTAINSARRANTPSQVAA